MFCLLSVVPQPFYIGKRGNENTKKNIYRVRLSPNTVFADINIMYSFFMMNSRYGQPTARTELECKVQTLQIEACLSANSHTVSVPFYF
jgi:hypothetical protein